MVSQQPYVTGLSDGLFGYFRGAVGIGQTARSNSARISSSRSGSNPIRSRSKPLNLRSRSSLRSRSGSRRKLIVSQPIGLLLGFGPPARNDYGDGGHLQLSRLLQLYRRTDTPMTGNQLPVLIDQRRIRPAPFEDRCADLVEVGLAVKPRIVRIRYQPLDRSVLDSGGRPRPCNARRCRPARYTRGWR